LATKRTREEPRAAIVSPEQMLAAIPRLKRRIQELKQLDVSTITERGDSRFEAIEKKIDHNLAEIFGTETADYNRYRVLLDSAGYAFGSSIPFAQVLDGYRRGVAEAISNLETIVALFEERLDERKGLNASLANAVVREVSKTKIFIVHGHDQTAKLEVVRFLEKLSLEPVVLHEQVNSGLTIIEKFEKYAKEASFAIVLLTPDDLGYAASGEPEPKYRARQNVVLELGYFVGILGRNNVVAIHKGKVEIPSDFDRVLYEPMDERGAWKLNVARELRQAGFSVDLNTVV
jgi:predicted nucleotide-binding protein